MASRMIRCGCGTLFDTAKHDACPACGAVPATDAGAGSPGPAQPAPAPVATPAKSGAWKWLVVAGVAAVAVLAGAYFVREAPVETDDAAATVDALKETVKTEEAATTEEAVATDEAADTTETTTKDQPSTDSDATEQANVPVDVQPAPAPTPAPAPAPAAIIDPRLVGVWVQDVTLPEGTSRWQMTIHSDGAFDFIATGAGAPPRHSGQFQTSGNLWSVEAPAINWTDAGTFDLPNESTFVQTGKVGTGVWRRAQ